MVDNDELTDFTSNTTVGPDGSFRFRIPKPNVEKTEGSSVAIKIEATSEGAIETEEIYGKFGGDFEGELTKETKRENGRAHVSTPVTWPISYAVFCLKKKNKTI